MQKPAPLGFGLGLRPVYYPDIFDQKPPVDWFEVISENYMVPGARRCDARPDPRAIIRS